MMSELASVFMLHAAGACKKRYRKASIVHESRAVFQPTINRKKNFTYVLLPNAPGGTKVWPGCFFSNLSFIQLPQKLKSFILKTS